MHRSTVLLILLTFACGLTRLAWSDDSGIAADVLARKAVVAGMLGDDSRRDTLLVSALNQDPKNAMANWAQGRVLIHNDWVTLDDYEKEMQDNQLLAAYDKRREDLKQGRGSEQQLAAWCRKNRLVGREKIHLLNIWNSESASADLRMAAGQRLGMKNVGGVWMTPTELKQFQAATRTASRNAAAWKPKTEELLKGLESKNSKRRQVAIERYGSGLDRTAVVSIESLLSSKGTPYAMLAVKFVGEIPDYEATESLARHAVYADSGRVREAAVIQLATREQQDVVPLLLAELSNPLEADFGVSVGRDGMVRRTQEVMERGREANVRHVNTTARGIHRVNETVVRVNRQGQVRGVTTTDDALVARKLELGDYDSWEERLAAEHELRQQFAWERQWLVQQEIMRGIGANRLLHQRNQRASVVNERAIAALENVTEAKVEPKTADAWWEWWNDTNERYQDEKPTVTRTTELSDPMRISYARACECFPAGTLVRTQTGLRKIESIEAGDQVLAQHTESGELGYKLVLATTLRPPSSMVTIGFDGGEIESTSGHLFWVEEHGWKMAKNLEPDDLLHAIDGARRVSTITSRPDAEAHNLVVAEFGNYFVGNEGILVHDNSERRRSNAITPGVPRIAK